MTTAAKKYRTGFEPDKSTATWKGRHVRILPESGGFEGECGSVIEVEVRKPEYGWFRLLFDNLALREKYPNGILMHSTEVEFVERSPA